MSASPSLSDADAAALYDLLCPWNPEQWPADGFYDALVSSAATVLDVGCGTGSMLHSARRRGHTGRLVGLDPDPAMLARARRRTDVTWVRGTAAEVRGEAEYDLVTMTGHAFQCLVEDEELRASLAAIRAALRPDGLFAFETRHPQARAWEAWRPSRASEVVDASGRVLRVAHEVDSVDGDVVAFATTTSAHDGAVLRTERTRLRFLAEPALDAFLHDAGFTVRARYGGWDRAPVTDTSTEIITLAGPRSPRPR